MVIIVKSYAFLVSLSKLKFLIFNKKSRFIHYSGKYTEQQSVQKNKHCAMPAYTFTNQLVEREWLFSFRNTHAFKIK